MFHSRVPDRPDCSFWQPFAERFWEKDSYCVDSNVLQPPLTSSQMFNVVVENCAEEPLHQGFTNFYINKRQVSESQCRDRGYYPKPEDRTFSGYHSRLRRLLGDADYLLSIEAFHLPDSARQWVYGFLKDMYRHTGANISSGHYFSLFFGDHRGTPFDIHEQDNSHQYKGAFYFPLEGQKQVQVWPTHVTRNHSELYHATDNGHFIRLSQQLKASQGGLMYWPSDRSHLTHSQTRDLAVPLAVCIGEDLIARVGKQIVQEMARKPEYSKHRGWLNRIKVTARRHRHLLKQDSRKIQTQQNNNCSFDPYNLQASAEVLPPQIKIAAKYYEKATCPAILEAALTRYWLETLSSWGLKPKAAIIYKEPLARGEQVVVFENHSLLLRYVEPARRTFIGVAGNVMCVPDVPVQVLRTLLNDLNQGQAKTVATLLDHCDPQAEHTQMLEAIIDQLQACGGIGRV